MNFIIKSALDWLYGKTVELFSFLIGKIKDHFKYKDIIEKNTEQADRIDAIRNEIINLIKNGRPVPASLKERLRDESRRLADGSNITDGNK